MTISSLHLKTFRIVASKNEQARLIKLFSFSTNKAAQNNYKLKKFACLIQIIKKGIRSTLISPRIIIHFLDKNFPDLVIDRK